MAALGRIERLRQYPLVSSRHGAPARSRFSTRNGPAASSALLGQPAVWNQMRGGARCSSRNFAVRRLASVAASLS